MSVALNKMSFFIVLQNLIDNRSRPMSAQEFLQISQNTIWIQSEPYDVVLLSERTEAEFKRSLIAHHGGQTSGLREGINFCRLRQNNITVSCLHECKCCNVKGECFQAVGTKLSHTGNKQPHICQ